MTRPGSHAPGRRPAWPRLAPLLLLLPLAVACSGAQSDFLKDVCVADSQCPSDQLCFADGCGDPEENVAVEVTPDTRAGQYAQDFSIAEIRPQQDFELYPTSTVAGTLTQAAGADAPDAGAPLPYGGAFTVRVQGESLVIPGRVRRFETQVTSADGRYSLPLASGRFSLALAPADPELPPLTTRLDVDPGKTYEVQFPPLPPSGGLRVLHGVLVTVGADLVKADMEVQALAPDGLEPLSQPALVDRTLGTFRLLLMPGTLGSGSVLIRASPRMTLTPVPVPTKLFTVRPEEPLPLALEMGAFGVPVKLSGRVRSESGSPVANAVVYTRGAVVGGGSYRSDNARTNADGSFELTTLASAPGVPTDLWVVPPARSTSGLLRRPVDVTGKDDEVGDVTVPDRVWVRGQVQLPTGASAEGVAVTASAVEPLPGLPLPASSGAEVTSADGRFEMPLDPGVYQLEVAPAAEGLPRLSRTVVVPEPSGPPGTPAALWLEEPLVLSRGLIVKGRVRQSSREASTPRQLAASATVRFFRVSPSGRSHVLLAETVTDVDGNYTAILPTR